MAKPNQGFLQCQNGEWSFLQGRTHRGEMIELPHSPLLMDSLLQDKKLFKGWVHTTKVIAARHIWITSNLLTHRIHAKKVNATNLHMLEAPTLLSHYKLHPEDRKT